MDQPGSNFARCNRKFSFGEAFGHNSAEQHQQQHSSCQQSHEYRN
jgi:hypothetical protein